MLRLLFLHKMCDVRCKKNLLLPKIGIIIGKLGLIAVSDVIFLTTIAANHASATRISLINPSESICVNGQDACIKKISNDTLKKLDEVNTFLQIEPSSNSASKQGYNTDSFIVKLDTRKKSQISRSLKLSDVPIVSIGGTEYREFILTINETNQTVKTNANQETAKIVLEKLQVFLGNSPDLTNYPIFKGRATKMFDLEPNTVVLEDINWDQEIGTHDYFVYINNSFFADNQKGEKDRQYVYLFSKFSNASGGVESWSVRKLKRSSILPVAAAGGGGGGGGGILGGVLPFAGLLSLLDSVGGSGGGGIGGGGIGGGGDISDPGNNPIVNNVKKEVFIPDLPRPQGRGSATDVPEPSTVLGSLIGIGLLAKGRSVFGQQKDRKEN